MSVPYSLALDALRPRLAAGTLTPVALARDVLAAAAAGDRHHAWIHRLPDDAVLARAAALEADPAARALPLYGVPFAVKDNIDVAGLPTTAACPAFSNVAARSATAVQKLLDAGAVLIGKTNLDQFATGLVGTRSPYGACTNPFDPAYIAGGSSSGSALAVALNLVSFALGTDTAGSGRVPAAFTNIVGLKPTRGLVSAAGVVPACRSLDCVSVFAQTVGDAWDVFTCARGVDDADPFTRPAAPAHHRPAHGLRCGVPRASQLEFCGDSESERLYRTALEWLVADGAILVEIDYAPFAETAALLYQGPWVAERLAAIGRFYERHPDALLPVTREIIDGARALSAADAFAGHYRLAALRRAADAQLAGIDLLAVPSAPTIYTLAQIAAEPLRLNATLGTYTNFVNLLDLAALAVPTGFRGDGLPAGVTLIAPAHGEPLLCAVGDRLHRASGVAAGATRFALPGAARDYRAVEGDATVRVAVVGAHLSGMPLNGELTARGATLEGAAFTAPQYRLYALPGTEPPKPGLLRCAEGGTRIALEIWRMPAARYGDFVASIPAPLGIGTLELEDGRSVQGFLCEATATTGARDISSFGGWRAYVAASAPARN